MPPELGQVAYGKELLKHPETTLYTVPKLEPIEDRDAFLARVTELCNPSFFEKTLIQNFVSYYLSSRMPNRSMVLYHEVGVGKTCSAITLAEALLAETPVEQTMSAGASSDSPLLTKDERKSLIEKLRAPIWVVSPKTLRKSFMEQIVSVAKLMDKELLFSQCTADTYSYLIPNRSQMDMDAIQKRIVAIVKTRYVFITYEQLKSIIVKLDSIGQLSQVFQNKLLIVDEAHNLRIGNNTKKLTEPLIKLLEKGIRNRLLLMTATPLYNDANEIMWLLSLCTANDKRSILDPRKLPLLFDNNHQKVPSSFKLLEQLAQEYVSYVRGENPFTFATRLSPIASDIPIITKVPTKNMNGVTIPDDKWLQNISDGLVPTPISTEQLTYIRNNPIHIAKDDSTTLTELLQAGNAIFPTITNGLETGKEKGLYSCFTEVEAMPLQLKHAEWCSKPKNQPFRGDNLTKYAPKIQTILNQIEKSTGIIIIYTQFIWNGIVPLAIALECAGYSRVGGQAICKDAKGRQKHQGSYAILCGKDTIMMNSQEMILNTVNALSNKDGSKIKVLLLSRVASEGLTFRNVREVHILDPWYHLNLMEQITGRAIRTCSHTMLDLEDRNVTVFLHALFDNEKETVDLHSYHIASMKEYETNMVQKVIQSNALDCSLTKAMNHFPKALFKFDIVLRTSNGTLVPFHYGDDTVTECKYNAVTPTTINGVANGLGMIPTLHQRLRRIFNEAIKNKKFIFDHNDLVDKVMSNSNHPWMLPLINHALVEASKHHRQPFIDGYNFIIHRNKWMLVKPTNIEEVTYITLKGTKKELYNVKETGNLTTSILSNVPKDEASAILFIYTTVDSDSWDLFAKTLIKSKSHPTLTRLLLNVGALIGADELGDTTTIPIGYVNIFGEDDKFTATLYNANEDTFKEANELEIKNILKRRHKLPVLTTTNNKSFGLLTPFRNSKVEKNVSYHMEFKVMYPDTVSSSQSTSRAHSNLKKRRGIVCRTSNNKSDIIDAIQSISKNDVTEVDTKEALCNTLAIELYKNNRLMIPPLYKRIHSISA